jgi:hypothetical protein
MISEEFISIEINPRFKPSDRIGEGLRKKKFRKKNADKEGGDKFFHTSKKRVTHPCT